MRSRHEAHTRRGHRQAKEDSAEHRGFLDSSSFFGLADDESRKSLAFFLGLLYLQEPKNRAARFCVASYFFFQTKRPPRA